MELTASNMAILTSAASSWLRGARVKRAMTSTAFESQSTMTLAKGAEAGQASANPSRSFRRIADMGSRTKGGTKHGISLPRAPTGACCAQPADGLDVGLSTLRSD